MYKILIAAEAEVEIKQAKSWYEEQQSGLGENFTYAVKETIESLKSEIVEHKLVFNEVRRVVVKRFPYLIYYTRSTTLKTVKILAVLHYRQDQQKIRERK